MSDSTPNSRAIDLSYLKNEEKETILRDNYLFVIGINEYQNCTPLGNAVNDAQSFAKVLNEKYRFKEEHTYSLINEEATINKIDDTFKELKSRIRSEVDNLIIFFCGHGYYDEEWDTAYWVPVEARADRALGEYFSHEDLMKRINRIETHHTVVIADSCYSGAAFVSQKRSHDPNSQVFAKEPSRWMLASGRNEPVNDGAINQNSPFTKELLDILERESNAGIRMGTLVERLKTRVNHNYDQTPIGQPLKDVGDKGGEFIFFPRDNEEERWKEAKMRNTLEALELFLNDFRGGNFEKEARKSIAIIKAEELYTKISISPTEELCQEYLDKYPEGADLIEVSKIKFALTENRVWREALEANSLSAFESYLSDYPEGSFTEEARERKIEREKGQRAWKEADALASIQSYENFIKSHPDSEFFDTATQKLKEMKEWQKVRHSGKARKLEDFIKDFPESHYLDKANALLLKTEENKKKRKIRGIAISAVMAGFLVLGFLWFNQDQDQKEQVAKKMGIVEDLIKQGNFTRVRGILTSMKETFPSNKMVSRIDTLNLFALKLVRNDSLAQLKFEEKKWKLSWQYFRKYLDALAKGHETLKNFKNKDLNTLFSSYFDLSLKDSIDSKVDVIKDKLNRNKVAEEVLALSKDGDALFLAGKYEEALVYYDSARRTDTFEDAHYLADKIEMLELREFLPEMILVPGASYKLRASEESEQDIKSFYISKYEITNKQYMAFLNAKDEKENVTKWINTTYSDIYFSEETKRYAVDKKLKDLPVVGVSWYGAEAYAAWTLGDLPSEIEWEFAASAGGKESYAYSGSDKVSKVANIYWSTVKKKAQEGGSEKANGLGIYDMSGNVWEWVASAKDGKKVIKGGSINRKKEFAKIAHQSLLNPGSYITYSQKGQAYKNDLGFRIIRRKK
ncbi:MAG: SUMF1/EgtB/PvdO family nonheme iron enzyme [Bacteroidota bacterium]